jgi:hypothetical protein
MTGKIWILFFLLILTVSSFSQSVNIKIDVKAEPLNEVLVTLRSQYDFQFSFNDNQLSKYKVTVSETFQTKEDALNFLLKGLPFELKKSGEVFIIVPQKTETPIAEKRLEKKKDAAKIAGQILEAESYEPLPFSQVLINNHPMVTDVMGNFNYTASTDSSFHVRISHLGYYIYDTILFAGINRQFTLIPSSEKIPEITVLANPIEKATFIGDRPGKIKLNHNISRYLPGQGDNSVFNLIRLMPGILASGELSTDLLVWGSYEGHSQVMFDEFTLFGLKNYNDNISVVNPLIVKNIEIYKGGFDAKYGNRVGGLINISGKNGNLQKPVFTFNINQTTLNGMVEIPFFKCSSLMVAYRQTYYNLYDSTDFNIYAPISSLNKKYPPLKRFDVDVYPNQYSFRDLNLKYTVNFKKGDILYLSLYGGRDKFVLSADAEITRKITLIGEGKFDIPFQITLLGNEYNQQQGGSVYYGKKWVNGNSSVFTVTHSRFTKTTSDELVTENKRTGKINHQVRAILENMALENSIRNENTFNFLNGHQLETGAGLYLNETSVTNINKGLLDSVLIDTTNTFQNSRVYFYLQESMQAFGNLEIRTGFRLNYHISGKMFFPEPRLSASYKVGKNFKMNASWGLYDQFIYKIGNVDKDLNYTYLWVTASEKIPVLKASHLVGGISFFKDDFTVNIEGYYKKTRNLTRRVYETKFAGSRFVNEFTTYWGDAKSYGLDVYLKKDFGRHSVWASYSLSKAVERLAHPGSILPEYTPAPHDQRHEFKIAGIYNLKRFYFSANYVYGSGMQILKDIFGEEEGDIFYSRFDVATTYHFNPWGKNMEIGISILNLFNTQNLKYANLKRIKITQEIGSISVYSNAVPFTPTLFLKIVL